MWNLRGIPRNSTTAFNVGGEWTQVSVGFDRPLLEPPANDPSYPNYPQPDELVRVEIYLKTVNQDLDVDAAVLI